MNPSVFQLSRLEFRRVEIEANTDYVAPKEKAAFPQLDYQFNKVKFELATALDYPDNELDDPRHFTVALKLSIKQSSQKEEITLPYSVTVEGTAYLFFRGNEDGLKRFQFVRGTGYLMLYGAFREYVANFTSRSSHGLWFLPSPNFTKRVEEDAPYDLKKWEERKEEIVKKALPDKKRKSKTSKSSSE
jgi:hypothetical protein